MKVHKSYVVKLLKKPVVYVYRVAIEQTPFRGRIPGYSSEEDIAFIDDYIDKVEYIHLI